MRNIYLEIVILWNKNRRLAKCENEGNRRGKMLNILNSSSIMPTFYVFKLWRQKNETNLEYFLLFWILDRTKVLTISCIFTSILCQCIEIVVDTTAINPTAAIISIDRSSARHGDKDNKRRGDCFLCSCWRLGPLEAMPHFVMMIAFTNTDNR